MPTMIDGIAIASAATRLREGRAPILVATVVRIQGSSYRRPGARLIATTNGRIAGSVSGGCLERDLLRTGFWRSRSGPVVVRYDSSEPEEGAPVLGCGGVVDVLLEQGIAGAENDPLSVVIEAIASNHAVTLATAFHSTDVTIPVGARWAMTNQALVAASHPDAHDVIEWIASVGTTRRSPQCIECATARGVVTFLVEPIRPPPHLFVLGAEADALALVVIARHLGWLVTVWCPAELHEMRARLVVAGAAVESSLEVVRSRVDASAHAMAVVMAHNVARDRIALTTLLASHARYIGVLGPRHRTKLLAAELSDGTLNDPRLHSPVGLDLGAETPEEISLSISSELLAHLRRASSIALRDRRTIHAE